MRCNEILFEFRGSSIIFHSFLNFKRKFRYFIYRIIQRIYQKTINKKKKKKLNLITELFDMFSPNLIKS